MKHIFEKLKTLIGILLILGFFFFAILGGQYSWISLIFAVLLIPVGVLDEFIDDYSRLFKR